jgi:hypothetical protein
MRISSCRHRLHGGFDGDPELSQMERALVMSDTGFTDNNSAEAFSIPRGLQ